MQQTQQRMKTMRVTHADVFSCHKFTHCDEKFLSLAHNAGTGRAPRVNKFFTPK